MSNAMRHRAIWLNFSNDFDMKSLKRLISVKSMNDETNIYDINKYILPNGNVSGEALTNSLFPTYTTGYFLSHSHDNGDLAKCVANLIRSKSSVFFDEEMWYSADKLIETLISRQRKRSCSCGNDYYDLDSCLKNASLAYVLLCKSLQEVIMKSHTFLFIGTKESIYSEQRLSTLSPWIYYELKTINMIIKKEPMYKIANESAMAKIELPLALECFEKIEIRCDSDLHKWFHSLQ